MIEMSTILKSEMMRQGRAEDIKFTSGTTPCSTAERWITQPGGRACSHYNCFRNKEAGDLTELRTGPLSMCDI